MVFGMMQRMNQILAIGFQKLRGAVHLSSLLVMPGLKPGIHGSAHHGLPGQAPQ
jgi:hypothetical protein